MKDISRFVCLNNFLRPKRVYILLENSISGDCKAKPNALKNESATIEVCNEVYKTDDFTNITPKIRSHIGRNLHCQKFHPLNFTKQRIINHFYKKYIGRTGNPIFSVYDNLPPVVTTHQNFDSLLVPTDHVSRSKNDCYYINREYMLRSHMTAHQAELIQMGLDRFLMFGDVYRRDEINSTHYPVFHQTDGVRLFHQQELSDLAKSDVRVFANGVETDEKQAFHTVDASRIVEHQLKYTLVSLAQSLFGKELNFRWVPSVFPFTHPSWELEIQFQDDWLEVLGCGITRHEILSSAGAKDRIGWAFGIGLERLAMLLYGIPDIRLFWSQDSGFLNQFKDKDPFTDIKYKPVSIYPQCANDISFWLPEKSPYHSNDFYELVRDVGGGIVEQIHLIDEFKHPKTGRVSHCYRIVYRHMERTLTQEEVTAVHSKIANEATEKLGITARR